MYKEIIQALQTHFKHFQLNKPARKSELKKLQELFPNIDKNSLLFYEQYNGFNCHLDDVDLGWVYSAENIIESSPIILEPEKYPLIKCLVPIRADGCGDYDVIFAHPGVGHGSILFWDHEIYEKPSYILGSSILVYLQFLAGYLVMCFEKGGAIKHEFDIAGGTEELEYPWPFDTKWMIHQDRKIKVLLKDKSFSQLLDE